MDEKYMKLRNRRRKVIDSDINEDAQLKKNSIFTIPVSELRSQAKRGDDKPQINITS